MFQKVAKTSSEFTNRKIKQYHRSRKHRLHAVLTPGTNIFYSHTIHNRTWKQYSHFQWEKYKQFLYDMSGLTIANIAGELIIPDFLDIQYRFSIMPKAFYGRHEAPHKC